VVRFVIAQDMVDDDGDAARDGHGRVTSLRVTS
jgi:hypothetical protein